MSTIRTDYLVVGAGASGMAFVDTLVATSDVDVVLVDRQSTPGGHWNDAYPFARLHQPSAYYGVDSTPLGNDHVVAVGPEAGFYERATATEIRAYYEGVLEDRLLTSGRVRFLALSDVVDVDPPTVVSRLTGRATTVEVRRRIVDATHLAASVPSRHRPGFTRHPDAVLLAPSALAEIDGPVDRVTVLGGGKTAMDVCAWLLEQGLEPDRIRWVRPRDPWTLDRQYSQPLAHLPQFVEGLAAQLHAAATAVDAPDLFARLEDTDQLVRLAEHVEPTAFRGAVLAGHERDRLAQIEDVVRLGRVLHVGANHLRLEEGDVHTEPGRLHVDCTASGLPVAPPRPVFAPGRVTLQMIQTGVVPFSAALIAMVEASPRDDEERNRLCPPNPAPSHAMDWIRTTLVTQQAHAAWRLEPDVTAWLRQSRLNALRGLEAHQHDPAVRTALLRMRDALPAALANLARLSNGGDPRRAGGGRGGARSSPVEPALLEADASNAGLTVPVARGQSSISSGR